MNSLKLLLILLSLAIFTVSTGWCNIGDELLSLDKELANLAFSEDDDVEARKKELLEKESALFLSLLESEKSAVEFLKRIAGKYPAVKAKFLNRIRFEVAQEGRTDLAALLGAAEKSGENKPANSMENQRIAHIYGNKINLLDGLWHNSTDGKRFWISNEYPDIILSPAEYKRYLKSATVTEN